jgi:biopolymer transport protein ExbD
MHELLEQILEDISYMAEHKAGEYHVPTLQAVLDVIEAREYEHSAMVEAKEEINYNKFLEVMRDTDE